MYHPRLYGTPYEMGLKYGQLLYEKVGFQLPERSPQQQQFGAASYPILADFYPAVIAEIEGFAQGIHTPPEQLGAFLLSLGTIEPNGQCSVFAYRNSDSVVVGRNYDMLFEYKKFTESSLIAPAQGYAYISQSDVFIGRSDGINEKGLFVAMSFVNGTTIQPGVSFHFIVRNILEQCATVEEAIERIQSAPVAAANNFLVADASGAIAVVESAVEDHAVRRPTPTEPFLSITNQFVTPSMQAYDRGGVEWSKSQARLEGLHQQLSQQSEVSLEKAKAILSDSCVCLNLRKERFGTIWSVVAELSSLTIERAETKPRTTNYKPEKRLDWWLNKRS